MIKRLLLPVLIIIGLLSMPGLVYAQTPEPTPEPTPNIAVMNFSGGDVYLQRSITYGDIAVVVALLGVIGCMILYMFIRVPRLWKR